MSDKIKIRSKEEMGKLVSGAADVNSRMERLESRELSLHIVALCILALLIIASYALLDWVLLMIGINRWYWVFGVWCGLSGCFAACIIIPQVITDRKRSKKDA